MADIEYMKKALEQAQKAYSKDEVPIGACLVDPVSKKIISKAHNQTEYGQDITAHAEILVLRKACKKLKSKRLWGLDLYVTLEPCQMCAGAIVQSLHNVCGCNFLCQNKTCYLWSSR